MIPVLAAVATVAALALSSPIRPPRADDCAVVAGGEFVPPLDRPVTVHVRQAALREVLDLLSARSGVSLAYSSDLLPLDRLVCVSADAAPLGAALERLLNGTGIVARVVAGRVVLTPVPESGRGSPMRPTTVGVLDRVVVTGAETPSPRRALAIGLDVIDGSAARTRPLASLAELLDLFAPGIWAWSGGPASMLTQYAGVRGASSFSTSVPKIYIDGIEVANPLVVTHLDADVIDRIEVIRGPQGAALYGADAISGVVNIVTRHEGAAAPDGMDVRLQSLAGATGSAYAAGAVATHDQRLTVRAGDPLRSAAVGVAFTQSGPVIPAASSRQLIVVGDGRLVGALGMVNTTLRFSDHVAGRGENPLLAADLAARGASGAPQSGTGGAPSTAATSTAPQTSRQYTLGGSAVLSSTGRWTHSLTAGVDGYRLRNVEDARGIIPSALDSALRAARGAGDRASVRGSSALRVGDENALATTLTVGVEQSVLRQLSTITTVTPPRAGQRYATTTEAPVEWWNHDTGLFAQAAASIDQRLFLSGGLRVERNDAFSGGDRSPLLPLLGATLVHSEGDLTLKLRAAYGRGIRPPRIPLAATARVEAPAARPTAGLDPESQSGIEGGAELYVGRVFSLQVTRFDQRASGLIQNVVVGVDTVVHGASTVRRVRSELQNVGSIGNRGWEAQGNLAAGALALSGTLAFLDSRVRSVARGYTGDLRIGDRMLAIPARTATLAATWSGSRGAATLSVARAENWINYDRLGLSRTFASGSTPSRDLTGTRLRQYWRRYDGPANVGASLSGDIARGVTLVVSGANLLGHQLGEPDNLAVRPGRTIVGGVRASF